jgi:hypothetical protein
MKDNPLRLVGAVLQPQRDAPCVAALHVLPTGLHGIAYLASACGAVECHQ